VLVDFEQGSYRITDVQRGKLNTSFVLSRPYGSVHLRMTRWGRYSANDAVLDHLVAAAAGAEHVAVYDPSAPLSTVGDVQMFVRMCAAYGPGAERATAVTEAEVVSAAGSSAGLVGRREPLLLVTFPDRLVLLDPSVTTHARSVPVADFVGRTAHIAISERATKHLDVAVSGDGQEVALRVSLYGSQRINDAVVDAIRAVGTSS
jgi:hypothetical protein